MINLFMIASSLSKSQVRIPVPLIRDGDSIANASTARSYLITRAPDAALATIVSLPTQQTRFNHDLILISAATSSSIRLGIPSRKHMWIEEASWKFLWISEYVRDVSTTDIKRPKIRGLVSH